MCAQAVPARPWLPAALVVLAAVATAQPDGGPDPFAFFGVSLTDGERARLRDREAIVKLLPRGDREMAVFSAAAIEVGGERLAAWVHAIDELKRSERVPAIGRFSDPPRIEDLEGLRLDDEDLEEIRGCRPGSCGVKLSASEMASLADAVAADADENWRPLLQDAYRQIVLARVDAYLAGGYEDVPPYEDQDEPVPPGDEFAWLLERAPFLEAQFPQLTDYLQLFPGPPPPGIESFLYWSKETLGGKPIVLVTHVFIVRGDAPGVPEVLVASRHVYANHYMTGALALTAITRADAGSPAFLTYLNRSRIDVLSGFFGGLTRLVVERRMRGEASEVVEGFRTRLESAPPPS